MFCLYQLFFFLATWRHVFFASAVFLLHDVIVFMIDQHGNQIAVTFIYNYSGKVVLCFVLQCGFWLRVSATKNCYIKKKLFQSRKHYYVSSYPVEIIL